MWRIESIVAHTGSRFLVFKHQQAGEEQVNRTFLMGPNVQTPEAKTSDSDYKQAELEEATFEYQKYDHFGYDIENVSKGLQNEIILTVKQN